MALTEQERETYECSSATPTDQLLLREQEHSRPRETLEHESKASLAYEEREPEPGDERNTLRAELDMLQASRAWRAVGKYRQIRDSVSRYRPPDEGHASTSG